MRMRRKKNLEERMAACSAVYFAPKCENRRFDGEDSENEQLDLADFFGRTAPLVLEIGCGKGKFAREYATLHPEVNYLGVEKCENVLVTACEQTLKEGIKNLKYLKCSAEYLARILPEKSVSALYLNFSTPFQKNSYAEHRLTAPLFLNIYRKLLQPNAVIYQKTDNVQLFQYSIEQFSQNRFGLNNVLLDLHHSAKEPENIITEYEQRFVSEGLPIYYLEAKPLD